MSPFKVGDKVQLKSGGPEMTVRAIGDEDDDDDGQVSCMWFAKELLQQGSFPAETIVQAQSKPRGPSTVPFVGP